MSRYMQDGNHDRCTYCGGLVIVTQAPLTKKQERMYRFIAEYMAANDFAPSFEEIALHFGYASLATVHEHLHKLEVKGWLKRDFNRSRAITCLVPLVGVAA